MILVLRPDLQIAAANNGYLQATNTTREEVLGHNIFDIFPDNPAQQRPTGVRNLRASLEKTLETRQIQIMALQRYDVRSSPRHGDFKERWWSVTNAPVLDENDEVKYILHQVIDMTDYVLLQKETKKQNKIAADLREQTEKMEEKIFLDQDNLRRVHQELVESNRQLAQSQVELSHAHAKLDEHARDLERVVCERTARLEATLKTSQELMYTLAHDLRAPLRAMRGFTEALLDDYATQVDALGSDYIRRIHEAAGRMDRLISDLLEYGRIAHVPLSRSRVDLESEVRAVIEQLSLVIERRGAKVQVKSPLPSVCGEKVLVEKVLRNLLDNSLKFVPAGTVPQVNIHAERSKRRVRIWVVDNGIGIAPQHRERIFGIFQRLHKETQYPGTGLGLALVQRAVDYMGGAVGVESEIGQGSRFWVELPDETCCEI